MVDRRIARIAAAQGGAVSRWQLLEAGVASGAIGHRCRSGRLHPLHRGVYAVGHPALGRHGREWAALLACGADAVLSYRSAAVVWGMIATWEGDVDVTAPRSRRATRRGLCVHSARRLSRAEVRASRGLRLTSPARTLLDLAEVLPRRGLVRTVNEARVLGLATPLEIERQLARSPGRHGRADLARALGGGNATRSELEDRFSSLIRATGLPTPEVNARVGGYEVDFMWPDQRVIVETDGLAYHGHRAAIERDRRRDLDLEALGWRVLRLTYGQVHADSLRVAARLGALLAA